MTDQAITSEVLIVDVTEKEGAKDGVAWKKYSLKDGNNHFYGTFDGALGSRLIEYKGKRVRIHWKPSGDGKFKNLLNMEPLEDSPIASSTPEGAPDWDIIGLRKTRCLLWAEFLGSQMAATIAHSISAREEKNTPADVVMAVYKAGTSIMTLAEADIFLRAPVSAEDEGVPF